MIIFDLDGTLANCEHRRHFVDPEKNLNYLLECCETNTYCNLHTGSKWKPDWDAFHETCDKDTPIKPVIDLFYTMQDIFILDRIQIWSGRSESVRQKTIDWLLKHASYDEDIELKMRPIGDYTPDEQLKERWLDEVLSQGKTIEFVVDDRRKVVEMWRRRGVFVFDVNQSGKEF